jgi:hypothetical protein
MIACRNFCGRSFFGLSKFLIYFMSDLKSMEEGFSEFIPNEEGIPQTGERSEEIRKEHNRWKKEVREMKNEQSLEELSYWEVQSSCLAL